MSVTTEVEFNQLSNDLFWSCYHKAGDHFKRITWQGYDDAYWWTQVATSPEARRRKCECGRTFEIDFQTHAVKEVE